MVKGRTTAPIRVLVAAEWWNHPAVEELRKIGHVVTAGAFDADLILHPAAHGWSEALFEEQRRANGTPYRPFVDAAVKAARARKRTTR